MTLDDVTLDAPTMCPHCGEHGYPIRHGRIDVTIYADGSSEVRSSYRCEVGCGRTFPIVEREAGR